MKRNLDRQLPTLLNCVRVAAMQFRVDAAVCVNEPRTAAQFTLQADQADELYAILENALGLTVDDGG
jgi:hypothetical protein